MSSDNLEMASISERAFSKKGRRGAIIVCGLFFVVGIFMLYGMTIKPALLIVVAKSWIETPCIIVRSQVIPEGFGEDTTYSVDILYDYNFNGNEYRSDRYKISGGWIGSGYENKHDLVAPYPEGTEKVCYVNPDDPAEAVLERGFTGDLWLGLISLPFVTVGALGIFALSKKDKRSAKTLLHGTIQLEPAQAGPVTLKSEDSLALRFIGLVLLAAFWNGVVSFFIIQAINNWQRNGPNWFEIVCLVPFVIMGLGLIGLAGYSLLALLNPRSCLTVNSGCIPLGGKLDVQWELKGRIQMIDVLRICLKGREEASYERGTTTHTESNTFSETLIAEVTDRSKMRKGQSIVNVPIDSVPSFSTTNNRIIWSVCVEGRIRRRPDINDEYIIQIVDSHNKHKQRP